MENKTSGAKTLMWSVIMSSPAPIVVGLSLINGHSSTQIADLLRRTSEFIAIVMSFVVYKITVALYDCEYFAPCFSSIFAYTAMKVNASVSNVVATVTIVGNGQ